MFSSAKKKFSVIAPLCIALGLFLGGCGGDTGESSMLPYVAPKLEQGRWVSEVVNPSKIAIVQPLVDASSMMWVLSNDGTNLLKLTLSGPGVGRGVGLNGQAQGKQFFLGTGVVSNVAGNFLASTGNSQSASPQAILISGVLPSDFSLTNIDAMSASIPQSRANGQWIAAAQGLNASWSISAGRITGESTTGCTYSGDLLSSSNIGIYEIEFSENCLGSIVSFKGIATINDVDTRLTVVATTLNETAATAIFFAKQN